MAKSGAYCEMYGDTIENRVLEFILTSQNIDWAVADIVEDLEVSKPTVYAIIKEFEEKRYISKSRKVGKTQLYILNKENKRVKIFLRNFHEVLDMIVEEFQEKPLATH